MNTLIKIKPAGSGSGSGRGTASLLNPNLLFFRPRAMFGSFFHVSSCSGLLRSVLSGRALHARLLVSAAPLPSHFILFYLHFRRIPDALRVFDAIPHSDPRRWTYLIASFSRLGFHHQALLSFRRMLRDGPADPLVFVLPSALMSCRRLLHLWTGECIHALVVKHCMQDDLFVACGLIDMYSRCGPIGRARLVFEGLPVRDLAVLNALVSGYAQHGSMEEALQLVEDARPMGLKPDLDTWNCIVSGFSCSGDASIVPQVFQAMVNDGFEPDVVSWTAVISGFIKNFRIRDALVTFSQMLANGIRPNSATISSILPASASLADLRRGKEIHGYAVTIGVEKDTFVRSALVDMYGKCGLATHARILFDQMSDRSSVSWNSMIFGLANNGYCNEAVEMFGRLEKEDDSKIDHLTFTAALTACSNGGMVELGRRLFNQMQEVYGIRAKVEHYACMVDLLGRGGHISEAHSLIRSMPMDMEADKFVWGALLGACRLHGNIEVGEVAAGRLCELEPHSPGRGLCLSGLYAEAGGWGEAARMKRTMRRSKMRKFMGRTWIQYCQYSPYY